MCSLRVILLFTLIILSPSTLLAAQPLGWDNIADAAQQSFEDGPEKALRMEVDSLKAQRSLLPNRVMDVHASTIAQIPLTSSAKQNAQHQIQAGASFILGSLPSHMETLLETQIQSEQAHNQSKKLAYFEQLLNAYASWWQASLKYEHITQDVLRAHQDSEPLRQAFESGSYAELDWLDLEVALAALSREELLASDEQSLALQQLQVLIDQESWTPTITELHEDNLFTSNPWETLLERVQNHPTIIALDHQASVLRAQANVEQHLYPTTLSLDAGWTGIAPSTHWSYVEASISIPLSNPGKAEAARKRIQANSVEQEKLWQIELLRREILSQITRYNTLLHNLEQLTQGELATLHKRQTLLEDGFKQKQVTLARVLQGRRDLHEASHHKLELLLQLQVHTILATQLNTWITSAQIKE